MYGRSFDVPISVMDENFIVDLDKAKIQREGKHVTITAFSRMVGLALEAADILAKEGIICEVINLPDTQDHIVYHWSSQYQNF